MKDNLRNRLIASGIVAVIYGAVAITETILEHKQRREQKKIDTQFQEIISNF